LTSFIFLIPQTTKNFRSANGVPRLEREISGFGGRKPLPEVFEDLIKLAADAVREEEGTHGIRGYSSSHRLDENQPASLGKGFCMPPFHL
jgi:hypothetical protein